MKNMDKIISRFLLAVAICLASTSTCPAGDAETGYFNTSESLRVQEQLLTRVLREGGVTSRGIESIRSNINSLKRRQDLYNRKRWENLNEKFDKQSGKRKHPTGFLDIDKIRGTTGLSPNLRYNLTWSSGGNRYASQPQSAISRNMIQAQLYMVALQQHNAMMMQYARQRAMIMNFQRAIMMNQYRR